MISSGTFRHRPGWGGTTEVGNLVIGKDTEPLPLRFRLAHLAEKRPFLSARVCLRWLTECRDEIARLDARLKD